MPLSLDERSVSRQPDRPALYRQLAAVIRAAIDGGDLAPGEALPVEADIAEQSGLGRNVVREALAELVHEGRIVKAAGMPSRVAPRAEVLHLSTARYQRARTYLAKLRPGEPLPQWSAFAEEHGIPHGERYTVRAVYDEDIARPPDVARLNLEPGAGILRRSLVKLVDGRPKQLQWSTLPLALARGTAAMDKRMQPWPCGTMGELYSIGHPVGRVIEEAQPRMPTLFERDALEMAAAGPVWDILRIFFGEDGVPLEASVVVCAAAEFRLRVETRLD